MVYPRRNLPAEQWRNAQLLSLLSLPAAMLDPAHCDTVSHHFSTSAKASEEQRDKPKFFILIKELLCVLFNPLIKKKRLLPSLLNELRSSSSFCMITSNSDMSDNYWLYFKVCRGHFSLSLEVFQEGIILLRATFTQVAWDWHASVCSAADTLLVV